MSWLTTLFRRLLWLSLLGAAGGAVFNWWRARTEGSAEPPVWPNLESSSPSPAPAAATPSAAKSSPAPTPAATPAAATSATSAGEGAWVEPSEDGSCPITHPIKANENSMIFHEPGGRFYDRTRAERCYNSADAAIADGYRRSKA